MKEENKELFNYISKVYSKSKVIDYIKFLYEKYMGPSHYKLTEEGILSKIEKEKYKLKASQEDLYIEPIGNDVSRVYLSKCLEKGFSIYTFIRLYLISKEEFIQDKVGFDNAIQELRVAIQNREVLLSLKKFDKEYADYVEDGYPRLSHSDTYKKYYNPHYLLMKKDITSLFDYFLEIDTLILAKGDYVSYLKSLNEITRDRILSLWTKVYKELPRPIM